jgi:phosphatidate phosphatase PAH1
MNIKEKYINIYINGQKSPFKMKLGENGVGYFE